MLIDDKSITFLRRVEHKKNWRNFGQRLKHNLFFENFGCKRISDPFYDWLTSSVHKSLDHALRENGSKWIKLSVIRTYIHLDINQPGMDEVILDNLVVCLQKLIIHAHIYVRAWGFSHSLIQKPCVWAHACANTRYAAHVHYVLFERVSYRIGQMSNGRELRLLTNQICSSIPPT